MKKIVCVLLCTAVIMSSLFAITASGAETYKDILDNESVIDIYIDTDDADLEDMRKYPENEEYHSADITVDGVKIENAGIRTKGNMTLRSIASSESERYSYRIKFNKYVKGQKLLGLDELCLNSGYSDPSYMREYLHYKALRELGMNVPYTAFCNVYIKGELSGFYLAVEGLDSTFLKEEFGENYKNGNFYKMEEGSTLEYKQDENYSYAELKSGDDTDLSNFKEFVKNLNEVTDGEKGNIESFLNVESALKYFASNTVLCNYDSYQGSQHHNFYLYEDENGVFTVVPWDFNMSMGGFGGSNSTVGIDSPIISGSMESLPLLNKLLSVPEYKEEYYGYIKQLMTMLDSFESDVTAVKSKISKYVQNDPTAFYTYEEFESAVSADGDRSIVKCINDRLENLAAQFAGTADKVTEVKDGGRGEPGGQRPEGMTPPDGGNGQRPEGMTPPDGGNGQRPEGMTPPDGGNGQRPGKFGGTRVNENSPIRVHVKGHIVSFDTAPYTKNDTTLVGFRAILEKLGATVSWNENTKTVTAVKNDTEIKLTIGSDTAYVNGEAVSLLAAPELSGDSTLIPVRFIAEQLGMSVDWNESTKLITIN